MSRPADAVLAGRGSKEARGGGGAPRKVPLCSLRGGATLAGARVRTAVPGGRRRRGASPVGGQTVDREEAAAWKLGSGPGPKPSPADRPRALGWALGLHGPRFASERRVKKN